MGLFYWSLGILTVTRMVTQGLGYSGRTVFSGAAEMVARAVVSLGFVGTFGYTAICFADQAAWIAACCYSVPTCLWCVKKSIAKLKQTKSVSYTHLMNASVGCKQDLKYISAKLSVKFKCQRIQKECRSRLTSLTKNVYNEKQVKDEGAVRMSDVYATINYVLVLSLIHI